MHALVRPVALRRVFLGIGFVVGMRGALLAQPTPAGESPPVSTAGVRFMTGMILHHAQALEMTALITGRSADDRLARLGERIAVSQRDEIALMAEWLRDRRQALPEPASPHAHHEHGPMPGMASPADMAALADLRGAAFDRRFLTLMIRHHEGALVMVKGVLGETGPESARRAPPPSPAPRRPRARRPAARRDARPSPRIRSARRPRRRLEGRRRGHQGARTRRAP